MSHQVPTMALKEFFWRRDDDVSIGWESETMLSDQGMQHKHILTAVAAFERGRKRYLLFPWADGGDLREFWTNRDMRPASSSLVLEALKQMLGLAEAIATLHSSLWRHGDVKPENILRFEDGTALGTFKIGDLDLARQHQSQTTLRRVATMTRYGTARYEAPEAVLEPNSPRSRRYDLWSLGCVMIEFVVWLLYGPAGLQDLDQGLEDDNGFPGAFYSIRLRDGHQHAVVHDEAKRWLMAVNAKLQSGRATALGDLTRLVQDRMLVCDVQQRADAGAVVAKLSQIVTDSMQNATYLFPPDANSYQQRWAPCATPAPTPSAVAHLPLATQAFGDPWRQPEATIPEVCTPSLVGFMCGSTLTRARSI